jgi:transcription initiation factor TFIIE subunit alpha
MNCDFNCPGCGKAVTHFDNEVLLKSLKERIDSIKKSLGHASSIG